MSEGHRVNTPPKIELPNAPRGDDSTHLRGNSEHEAAPPGHLKQNAAQHFDHDWQNSRAGELKNNLLTMLLGSQRPTGPAHGNETQNANQNDPHPFSSNLTRQTTNDATQSLQNLIGLAREHADFKDFHNRPESFWQSVGRMSEVKILQSGAGELRLVSRYGELLDQFNARGERLETFLLSLPAAEREVFAARYQLEKTFGAGRLFVGNGITPDKNGNFSLRQFLGSNGKSVDLPLNFAVSMRQSGLQLGQANSIFAGQILLNSESAALLGVSLAFYQNLGASVNLQDAVIFTLLQNFLISAEESAATRRPANSLASDAAPRKIDQPLIVGALINGSIQTINKNSRFFDKIDLAAWTGGDAARRPGFSAGATGAMLGAAIGCLVPLAGTVAGRATGLATSIVIGTAERGLRSIDLNLLISDVVTGAVQTLLDHLQDNLLNDAVKASLPPAALVEDLRSNFSNRRMNAHLTA